jgi:glutamate--cysteine ligase
VQRDKIRDPDLTPSARMLKEMRAAGEGFHDYARRMSEAHGRFWRSHTLDPGREARLVELVSESRRRQAEIEAADDTDFDTFLARYFAQGADTAA